MTDEYEQSLKRLSQEVNNVTGTKSFTSSFDFSKITDSYYIYIVIVFTVLVILIILKPNMVTYKDSPYKKSISITKLIIVTLIISAILSGLYYFWNRKSKK